MGKETNKQKALIALLSTNTVKEAAKDCDLSVETLYRFLRDVEFLAEYRSQRRNLMEATLGRIQQASDQAVHTLRRNLACGHSGSEIRAAQIILDQAIKGIEITELLERIELLEAKDESGS